MKKQFLTLLFVCLVSVAFAQNNNWGIGVRLGEPSGITLKKYMGNNAWDLTVGTAAYGYGRYGSGGLSVMFNYLWHNNTGVEDLQWYYGVGANLNSRRYADKYGRTYNSSFGLGVNGAVGLEYFIPGAPISLFADVTPTLSIIPGAYLYIGGGLGGRFLF